MSRFLSLATIVGLLCLPLKIDAQYQVIELADVQLVKSLSAGKIGRVQRGISCYVRYSLAEGYPADNELVSVVAVYR